MDKILYTEIRKLAGDIKEVTVLYESDYKLYVSYKKDSPRSGVRLHRQATLADHGKYTLALVEQKSINITH